MIKKILFDVKVIKSIEGVRKESEKVVITFTDNSTVAFYHNRVCCEQVRLLDFEYSSGLSLVGATITSIEEVDNLDLGEDYLPEESYYTWTFYKIQTDRGELWMRWLGESNGYYSETVDIKICS